MDENPRSLSDKHFGNYLRYLSTEERHGVRNFLADIVQVPELPLLLESADERYGAAKEWENDIGIGQATRSRVELGEHRGRVESSWSDGVEAGAGVVRAWTLNT
jgi:hypothetical protein